MFVDEQGQQVSEKRLQLVQGELASRGLEGVSFVEEEVEAASVGKGSVAVGEVADNLEADLVVLSTAGERRCEAGGGRVPGTQGRQALPLLPLRAASRWPARAPRPPLLPPSPLPTAVHEKHVDANLLAEFVPCESKLVPCRLHAAWGGAGRGGGSAGPPAQIASCTPGADSPPMPHCAACRPGAAAALAPLPHWC